MILQHDPALRVLPVVRPPLELTGGNGFLECQRVMAGFHQAYTVEPVLDARPSHNDASLIPDAWWVARIHGPVAHFQNIQGGGDVMRRCIDARAISRIVILIVEDLIFRPEYQILDDEDHYPGYRPSIDTTPHYITATLYVLEMGDWSMDPRHPPGIWNQGRIVVRGPSHNDASLIPDAWWVTRIHGPVAHFQNIQGGGDVMRRCIDARAISRIVILIVEDLIFRPEYQILDDEDHYPGYRPSIDTTPHYITATLYVLEMGDWSMDPRHPPGIWNQGRIVVRGPRIEHWLNGVCLVETRHDTLAFKEAIASSKFKRWPHYGQNAQGRIMLQDHGTGVAFKEVQIRSLDTTASPSPSN